MFAIGQSSQEKEERYILQAFLADAGIEMSHIQKLEPPSPDFLVTLPEGKKFYVELTNWHQGGNSRSGVGNRQFEQRWFKLMKLIVDRIEHASDRDALEHVSGLLSTKDKRLPQERYLGSLADELMELARANLGFILEHGRITLTSFIDGSLAATYIRQLTLGNARSAVIMCWECSDVKAAWVGMTSDEFITVLTPKAMKSQQYRAETGDNELWLLIYALDWTASTFAPRAYNIKQVANDQKALLTQAGYDQIWFYGRVCGDAVCMFPSPKIIRAGVELNND